jgi:hypothetical protein
MTRLEEIKAYWKENYGSAIANGDVDFLLAALAEKDKQIAILDRFQSLCHCGVLAKDHVFHDGHSPVPMIEPCPNEDFHAALLNIHEILLCPAECPPIAESDGWEVKALKCIIQDWHRAVKHNAMLRNRT